MIIEKTTVKKREERMVKFNVLNQVKKFTKRWNWNEVNIVTQTSALES